ncbi:MAG: signal peptidase II [Christensenellaceae bacterium]|jgi:signal peptidase II|nr:signal peptidase II [Christensenellaceae bacterium]
MLYLFFGIAVGVAAVDQITKFIMAKTRFVQIIPDFFSFSYTENTGFAFSWGANNPLTRWGISIFAIIVVVAGVVFFIKYKGKTKLLAIGGGLFIGGTVGNAIDRIIFGYVRDFIYLEFANNTSNLADLGITTGCILLGLWYILKDKWAK